MAKPLVTIITPTYNHEKFIGQCIESVLTQTYPHWEQIIIDDGSADRTSDIIGKYKDKRIRYIRQENMGIWKLGKIYNKALSLARGDLIAILEGDDLFPTDKLEKQIPSFENNKVVLSWGRGAYINEEGRLISKMKKYNFENNLYKIKPKGIILEKLLFNNFLVPTASVMVRTDSLISISGFKQPHYYPCVDYPTWLEIALQGDFYFVDYLLGYWRKHPTQSTVKLSVEQMLAHGQLAIEFYEKLPIEIKEPLNINIKELKAMNYWFRGRSKLIDKKWSRARVDLVQAIMNGSSTTRLKALLGLLASYLKIDIEVAAHIAGKSRLR